MATQTNTPKQPSGNRKMPAQRRSSSGPADRRRRGGKILITGAAGALAKHVIDIIKPDYEIVGVDFRGLRAQHPDTVDYEVDFNKRTFEDVFREHDFTAILHLGRIQSSQLDRNRRFSSNVIGTRRLFRLAQKYGVEQVVVMSTYHVYGADPNNPAPIDEDYPLQAANLHAELVDAVELDGLASIHLYKNPELNIHVLRPCNIAGPGVANSISRLLSQSVTPCLAGFSPVMQFIHVEDMARAIVACLAKCRPGIYNVAPDDWIAYQDALRLAGCRRLPLPPIPAVWPRTLTRLLGRYSFPAYLANFFKYAVVLDGQRFARTFDFEPIHGFDDIFGYYRGLR